MIFMATYIISIIYPFDHNCITSMVLPTFLFQNNYSIISTKLNFILPTLRIAQSLDHHIPPT
jgi:hypothetical protein